MARKVHIEAIMTIRTLIRSNLLARAQQHRSRKRRLLLLAAAILLIPVSGYSQGADSSEWQAKLRFHANSAYGLQGLVASATYAGYLQEIDSPREWGQGGVGYGRRLASTLAYSGVRNVLGFGLDSALHQDPRYYRLGGDRLWRRVSHAIRGTILTRTDSGGETFATWRFGSAYSAAFLSNQWRPDRVNTTKLSLAQGSTQIAFDLAVNLGSEFWPDVKNKMLHRRP